MQFRTTRFSDILKNNIRHNWRKVNVAYLVKDKHFQFNSEHFLTIFWGLSNKSGSIFYYICHLFLRNKSSNISQSILEHFFTDLKAFPSIYG